MSDLDPITREETAWANGDLEPITRKEKYIKRLYDETQEIPDPPQTREEWFIKKAGEEIHDVTIEPLTATDNGTYSESGKAYSPVTVAVPLGTKTITANGTYDATDDSLKGYSSVSVDVPLPDNGYLKKDLPTGAIATVTDAEAEVMPSLKVAITPVQSGSGDPSPSNVRPISGWTEAEVSVCGVNVWDEEWELGYYNASGVPISTNNSIRSKNYIPCKPNTSYYYANKSGVSGGRVCFFDKNKTFISTIVGSEITIETPSNCAFMLISTTTEYGGTYGNNLSINYPSTDTEYHAYTGTTYPIPFPSEAGTVYGGTLDVESGVLTVDRGCEVLTNTAGIYAMGYNSTYFYKDIAQTNIVVDDDAVCSHTVENPNITGDNSEVGFRCYYSVPLGRSRLVFRLDETKTMTLQEFQDYVVEQNSAGKPITVVYKLATPLTYQLSPTAIKTLLNTNNIFADTGDILDGEYWSKNPLTVTRAMLNTLRDAGEVAEITELEEPEETEENADER